MAPRSAVRSESSESTPDGHDVIDEISNCTINSTHTEYLYYVVWRPPKSTPSSNKADFYSPTATWEPHSNLDGVFGDLRDSMNKYKKYTDLKIRKAKLKFKRKRNSSTNNPGYFQPENDYLARPMNRVITPEGIVSWSFANECVDVSDDESWKDATNETSKAKRRTSPRRSAAATTTTTTTTTTGVDAKDSSLPQPSSSSNSNNGKPRKRTEPETEKLSKSMEEGDEDDDNKQSSLTHWMKNKRTTSAGSTTQKKKKRLTEDDFQMSSSKAPFGESSDVVAAPSTSANAQLPPKTATTTTTTTTTTLKPTSNTKDSSRGSNTKKVVSPSRPPPRLSGLQKTDVEDCVVQLEELLKVPNELDEMNWDILRRGIKEERFYVHKMRVPEVPVPVEQYGVKFKDVDSGEVIFTPTVDQVEQNLTGKCVMCEFYKRHLVPRRRTNNGGSTTETDK